MTNFMYTNRIGVYMAGKLYWRVKKDGKWTWRPAKVSKEWSDDYKTYVFNLEEERKDDC